MRRPPAPTAGRHASPPSCRTSTDHVAPGSFGACQSTRSVSTGESLGTSPSCRYGSTMNGEAAGDAPVCAEIPSREYAAVRTPASRLAPTNSLFIWIMLHRVVMFGYLATFEVLLDPVRPVVLAAWRTNVRSAARVGADFPLVVHY